VGTHDGVLCTANYVARKFGIRSAQPTFLAKSICPYLVLIPPNFEKYRKYSNINRDILAEFDENYESHGLDEAYVDITDHVQGKTTE
jgi:DNA polymerase kappa